MEKTEKSLELQRKAFERAYDSVSELIKESSINVIEVRSSMALLENKFNLICDLNKQLVEHFLSSDKDTDFIDSEIALADTYITKFHSLSLMVESLLFKEDNRSVQSEFPNGSKAKHTMKLPKIEMKKFGGDIKDWLHFWGQFQRIDSDSEMANEDKFYYLVQSTIPDSKARQIVESFPPTAANYPKALETLRSRFGRKGLLVEYYVRELLKLVLNNLNSKKKLSYLFDKIECQLRSLETLDVNTETCSAMLYPLVESCLPNDLLKVWQRSSYYNEELSLKDRLENLMSFLKKEVNNEEKYNMVVTGFELYKKKDTSIDKNMLPSASALVHLNEKCCIFCEKSHFNEDCPNALKLSYEDRKQKVTSKGCCLRCLKFGHISKKCRVRVKCSKCKGRHNHIICQKDSDTTQRSVPVQMENSLSNSTFTHVFLQTLKVKLIGANKNRYARLIFDTGSQRSYISKCAIAEMEYSPLRIEQMVHSLFGGTITETVSHTCFRIRVSSFNEKYICNFEALDQQIICNNIPCIKNGPWIDELHSFGVDLSDTVDGPIDILVGADIWGKLFTGKRHELSCGLVAYETLLGWTLSGKVLFPCNKDFSTSTALITSLVCNNQNITDLWSLDILGITDPAETKSRKEMEEAVKSNFLKTVNILHDGRYEVSMPWIEGHLPLPEYSNLALKRLESLKKKLKNDGYYDDYHQVFKDWLEENIIEEVPLEEIANHGHYLAHRHVVKLSSTTTKIRPVFDASAKEGNHPALNQCIEKGINFIELIPSIILRFRMSKIGVVSDIRKAFLQISLCKSDRDFLRFYWYDKDGNITVYRHARVVFGITCSPFLLGAVIDYHLRRKLDSCDLKYSRAIITRLLKSFYVDNCVTSLDSAEETQEFIKEATEIMAEAKFDLRGWEHSNFVNSTIQSTDLTSVLGLSWDKNRDTLEISADWFKHMKIDVVSRRLILSAAHKLYDPIGFTAPVSLVPKLLLQKSWKTKTSWDQEVDVKLKEIFLNWFNDLPSLFNLKIPRWLHVPPDKKCSLHVFCDASKEAYATVIFLRSEHTEMVSVQLVQAKSRVSPLKQLSVARLELLGATIASRLAKSIVEDFDFDLPVIFWTDSTTVLSWIKRETQWKTFVLNRISEIRKITDRKGWFYVPSELNPADLPSRGCSPRQLIKSKWWEGPEWLKKSSQFWPVQNYCYDEEKIIEEQRKQIVNSLFSSSTNDNFDWYHKYSHDFNKIVKVVAWVMRFISNLKARIKKDSYIASLGHLSLSEIKVSEKCVMKLIQSESFTGTDDPKLRKLCPFVDPDHLLRLTTKISDKEDTKSFRYPIVLPSKHPMVQKLISYEHKRFCHAGVQSLLSILRERFWILSGRRTVRSVISKCVVCKRFTIKGLEVPPIPLPLNRVREASVFEIIGIDLAGPLYIRTAEKCWICLFTCSIYRAIHLELVLSLSTDAFLQAFRRFVARRGRPRVVYTDNATNFVGAENALSKLNWDNIHAYSSAQRIEWRHIPPNGPWWGGWWEVLIKLVKDLLRKILGRASLTLEELNTVLCDCEAVINSRPLTYLGEDNQDLVALTPAMFLQDIKEVGVPDIDVVERVDLRKRYRYRLKIKVDLRRRFRNEYLGKLALFNRKQSEYKIEVGDVVLVGNDHQKRLDWPLAYVEETIPGRDGKIRLVRLKTADGHLIRPLQRIYPLEVRSKEKGSLLSNKTFQNDGSQDKILPAEIQTRYGRTIKAPQRLAF